MLEARHLKWLLAVAWIATIVTAGIEIVLRH